MILFLVAFVKEWTNLQKREALHPVVTRAINNLNKHGFVNYFGQQRFGYDQASAKIGLLLVQEDYMSAVKLLLQPECKKADSTDQVQKAKQCFLTTQNIKQTLKLMPRYMTRECLILQALNRFSFTKEGCLKAFLNIPHSMRIFYVHSYCSLVWNKVISKRIERHAFDILTGDLILQKNTTKQTEVIESEHLDSYGIEDIVFPLPGTSIMLPENESTKLYQDMLLADGVSLERFRVMKKIGFNITGAYRKIVVKPEGLSWKWLNDTCDICMEFKLPPSSYATVLLKGVLDDK